MMGMNITNKRTINTIRMDTIKITIKIKIIMIKIIINMRGKSTPTTKLESIRSPVSMKINEIKSHYKT